MTQQSSDDHQEAAERALVQLGHAVAAFLDAALVALDDEAKATAITALKTAMPNLRMTIQLVPFQVLLACKQPDGSMVAIYKSGVAVMPPTRH